VKITLTILVLCVAVGLLAQTPSEADHHAGVVHRGESHDGMGFSQTTTTHHFILTPNGGIVQVTANDPKNTEQIETIQMHMKHITEMFSEGNFSIPHFVHDQTPPGVPTMKELKDAIRYSAEPLSNGGRIKIETTSPEGIAAVHEFLRFQIKDHQTGDPTTVQQ
jgi:TusA-related sulfurtransferase